jgi:hypothetical protein
MERRFKVEAKTFFFSTKASQIRLEERRKGFLGLILVDRRGANWLAETVEEAARSPVLGEFVRASSEGRKSLSVRGGSNKGGRFLEVVALVDDERKGIIWIPEARSGRGWRRFVSELRSWLAVLDSVPRSSSGESVPEERSSGSLQEVISGRSYAEVLRSPSGEAAVSVGPNLVSSVLLDLLPVSTCCERVLDGDGLRFAVDCQAMECLPSSPAAAAVTPLKPKKMKGTFGNSRIKRLLGLVLSGLDRVLARLASKPKHKPIRRRIRVGSLGQGLVSGFGRHFKSGLDQGAESGSGLISNPDLDPGAESCPPLQDRVLITFGLGPPLSPSRPEEVSLTSSGSSTVLDELNRGVQSPALVSPVVDEEQVRLEGGRRSTSVASPPESSTGSVWSDGVSGHSGDGSGPSSPPLTVMGPIECLSPGSDAFSPGLDEQGDLSKKSSSGESVEDGCVRYLSVTSVQASEGSSFAPPDLSVTSDLSPECSCSSDTSEEGASSGSAENDLFGEVTESKTLADSAREESRAWFLGWVRASVQDDEELLAKLDVIEERTRHAKLDAISVDQLEMLQMREKLASMDIERGQALATAWLMVQDEECL